MNLFCYFCVHPPSIFYLSELSELSEKTEVPPQSPRARLCRFHNAKRLKEGGKNNQRTSEKPGKNL